MSDWNPRALVLRLAIPAALVCAGAAVPVFGVASAARAAEPASFTTCSGFLAGDPGGKAQGEPNLLDYTFGCSTPISAYTLIINRVNTDGNNIDDYSSSANVVLPTPYAIDPAEAGTISTSVSINCGGVIPSDGINCYATNGSSGTDTGTGDLIEGSVDPTAQYCGYLPKGAKPGTPAVPRALVELIVTDNTGAQDGPFELKPQKACPKVAAVVPEPKKKSKSKSKTKTKPKKK